MNKLKHTPGPWVNGYGDGVTGPTCPSALGPTCAGYEWDYTVVSKNMEVISIIPKQENGIMEANARLIAAAPEMLEALINVKKYGCSGYIDGSKSDIEFWFKIDMAIKKATGLKIEEVLNEN